MSNDSRNALQAVLEPGEDLRWSGSPDRDVMLKTLGNRKRSVVPAFLTIVFIAAAAWLMRDGLAEIQLTDFVSQGFLVPVIVLVVFAGLILLLRRKRSRSHVDNLVYGISDRRVLIVKKGEIVESRTPAEMKWVELQERIGAEGYSDIIWQTRPIRGGSGDTQSSPLEWEQARVGFKALADGPAVFELIERLRAGHQEAAREAAEAAVEALKDASGVPRVTHPRLECSIATPPGWTVTVRRKTFPFGKTRMDLNADKWYEPGRDDKWNVIRVADGANAEVVVEAVLSEPIATFEAMADPKVPDAIKKVMKVVDTREHINISGVDGFQVDTELSGKGDTVMAIGESSDKVQSIFRQIVLHDGAYQYHLTATWPKGSDAQKAACQAILESYKGCSAIVA